MDINGIQTDKLLLTVLASAIAGFLTAVMSIVKLVNEKESKTTEYRQSWTESLRKSLAEFISNLNVLAGAITAREEYEENLRELNDKYKAAAVDWAPDDLSAKGRLEKDISEEGVHIRQIKRELYQSYAFTRLHFKQNDEIFPLIEHKFDVISEMLDRLGRMTGKDSTADRRELREKVYAAVSDITLHSRNILKKVWEEVKQGERAYKLTKTWSLIGGGFSLLVIALLAAGTLLSWWAHRDSAPERTETVASEVKTKASNQAAKELNPVARMNSDMPENVGTPGSLNTQVVTINSSSQCPQEQKPMVSGSGRRTQVNANTCSESRAETLSK